MSIAPQMGFNAALYFLSSGSRASWGSLTNGVATGAAPADLTLIANCREVKWSPKAGKGDVTTRASAGFKQFAPTLFDFSDMKISQVYDPTDAGFLALLTANLTRATIALAILDNIKTVAGTYGIWADFMIEGFEKAEPIDGVQMVDWPIAFGYSAVPPQIVTVTA